MTDIEIKRGYEILPDNNVRFGVRVTNNGDSVISDVQVLLDYTESLFDIEGNHIVNLGVMPPTVPRTAKFLLKPLGCVHKEEIGATVIHKDYQWKKHMHDMRPKEVHCVCPFLKEKAITRAEFLDLSNSGYMEEQGVNFENIDLSRLVDFLTHSCKNRLYKVDEFPIENGKILYLAGEAAGDKAYYLLTAVVKEYDGLAQLLMRASSDKQYGLTGFMNEILDNLRHLVLTVNSAREIGIIKKEQVINIIDSVVQRTSFGGGVGDGGASVHIQNSVVQRTEFDAGEDRNIEEEQLRKEQEKKAQAERDAQLEREREEKEAKEIRRKQKEEEERQAEIKAEKERQRQEELRIQKAEAERKAQAELERKVKEEKERAAQENSIGMKFTHIPAGEFMMGSDESGDEQPVHKVKISKPFYLGTYPVTQREWKAVMGDNPSIFKGDDLPVDNVSWNHVQEFIKNLNQKEGADKYRLPSEAEWEYACRAGTTTRYSFGDDERKLGEYAWYSSNSDKKTHPVGEKKPNPWGLYGMHGNIREWVQDKWHGSYTDCPIDGDAWENGVSFFWKLVGLLRVLRGGGWNLNAQYCRSANRHGSVPGWHASLIGFRLLREM